MRYSLVLVCAWIASACGAPTLASAGAPVAPSVECGAYAPPPLDVGAEVSHNKTAGTVLDVPSACTVRVRVATGNSVTLGNLNDRVIVLRATSRTMFRTAAQGDLGAIGRFGLKAGDVFTLAFDGRPFPDGSYPLNYMNR